MFKPPTVRDGLKLLRSVQTGRLFQSFCTRLIPNGPFTAPAKHSFQVLSPSYAFRGAQTLKPTTTTTKRPKTMGAAFTDARTPTETAYAIPMKWWDVRLHRPATSIHWRPKKTGRATLPMNLKIAMAIATGSQSRPEIAANWPACSATITHSPSAREPANAAQRRPPMRSTTASCKRHFGHLNTMWLNCLTWTPFSQSRTTGKSPGLMSMDRRADFARAMNLWCPR